MTNQPVAFVRSIMELFRSYDRAARILKTPKNTVYFWARNGNIPYWRRDAVLKAAKRHRCPLTDRQIVYLQSEESAKDFLKNTEEDQSCSGKSEDPHTYSLAATPYNQEI